MGEKAEAVLKKLADIWEGVQYQSHIAGEVTFEEINAALEELKREHTAKKQGD